VSLARRGKLWERGVWDEYTGSCCKVTRAARTTPVRPIVSEPPSEQFAEVKKMSRPLMEFRAGQVSCA